jgi:hypothetical protein
MSKENLNSPATATKEKEKEAPSMKEAASTSHTTLPAYATPSATSEDVKSRQDNSPPRDAPQEVGDSLATVPVTDKCQHTMQMKGAPVLTSTISLSLGSFFRRVMGDGTNTWMLALRDPNADTYFTMTPWSLCKEVRALLAKRWRGIFAPNVYSPQSEVLFDAKAGVPSALPGASARRRHSSCTGAHDSPREARVRSS